MIPGMDICRRKSSYELLFASSRVEFESVTDVKTNGSAHGRMLGAPIRHDVPSESKLALHDVVQRLVVLACVRVVDQICS